MAREKILIIDDSKTVLAAAKAALQAVGYDVLTLNNPVLAAAEVVAYRPDLILLDVQMPLLDGTKVAAYLRKNLPSNCTPKILLYSALPAEQVAELARQHGTDGFIHKTSDTSHMVLAVAAELRRSAS